MSADLTGRICLITGATRGIGKAAATGIARMGATVVLACRDRARGEAAQAEIRLASGNQSVEMMIVDLASQRSIRELARQFRDRHEHLHLLVNNAGVFSPKRVETVDGIERTFAVNHLAYFLLTNLLIKQIEASAPARIINVSSMAHERVDGIEDPLAEKSYVPFRAYCTSKLANIYFTYQLSQRLLGTTVTANAMHPGRVRTGLLQDIVQSAAWLRVAGLLIQPFLRRPEKGADTIVYLASSPDVASVSGKYFFDRQIVKSSPASYDEIIANQLWERSIELTARSR